MSWQAAEVTPATPVAALMGAIAHDLAVLGEGS